MTLNSPHIFVIMTVKGTAISGNLFEVTDNINSFLVCMHTM